MNAAAKLLALALLLPVGGLCGCSGSSTNNSAEPSTADELQQVAGMLRDYQSVNNRGPAKAADLATFQHEYRFGYAAVQSGKVVVVWGSTMAGEGGGGRAVVVAYEKTAPSEGGHVLLENGTVKKMTAEEFNAAKPK